MLVDSHGDGDTHDVKRERVHSSVVDLLSLEYFSNAAGVLRHGSGTSDNPTVAKATLHGVLVGDLRSTPE